MNGATKLDWLEGGYRRIRQIGSTLTSAHSRDTYAYRLHTFKHSDEPTPLQPYWMMSPNFLNKTARAGGKPEINIYLCRNN